MGAITRVTLLSVCMVFAFWVTDVRAQPDNQLIDARARLLRNIHSFRYLRGSFLQTTKGRVRRVQQGTLFIAKPHKMRVVIDAPQKQLIVVDGQFIWHTRYALAQTVRRDRQTSSLVFGLLTSNEQDALLDEFLITLLPVNACERIFSAMPSDQGTQSDRYVQSDCFDLQSVQENSDPTTDQNVRFWLYFVYAPTVDSTVNRWQLKALRFFSPLGSTIDVLLAVPLDYSALPADLFDFTPLANFELLIEGKNP